MSDEPFPSNPYVIGVPLTGETGFYGRRDIFTFVKDALEAEQQNVIVLYGQRRVGKTSLLHQIAKQLKNEGRLLPVYFDLQGKEQQKLGTVLYSLARTIARPLKTKGLKQARFDDAGRFFREGFLPSLYQQLGERRLLLLFDEFDVLGDELTSPEAASETLFPYLQDLIMHQRQISFIFVVGRRIEELATHFQAIFKQALYRRIGLLKPDNARTLIVEPVKEVLDFETGAIAAILNLTAGHPYFTQLICFEIFNAMKANNRRSVTETDILGLVDQAIESGHGALTWFWDGLPRAERFIMSAVAHVTDETGLATKEAIRHILEKYRIVLTGLELTDAPNRLVEWEMLRRDGPDGYRFVVELVRRWIIKNHPLESARRDIDYISQRAVRLYENARDAHTEGDLEYARDEYRRALNANPNHSGAQLGLAQVLFELGQVEASIEEFVKAYAIDEMSARDGLVRARLAQGKKLEDADRPDEAIVQYEQALGIAPTHETVRWRLAGIWLKRGDEFLVNEALTTAFEIYQKAVEVDRSESSTEQIKLSVARYAKQAQTDGRYNEAIMAMTQLQSLLPEAKTELAQPLAKVWLAYGHHNLEHQGIETALEPYQKSLDFDRSEAIAKQIRQSLGDYAQQAEADHNYDEAIRAIDQLKILLPQDVAVLDSEINFWTRRGDALAEEGEGAEAIKAYQRALESSPGNETLTRKLETISAEWKKLLEADRLFNQAMAAHQEQDWPEAESAWLQLLKMDVLDYKGQNIAAFLAQAHDALMKNPGLSLRLAADPPKATPGQEITWTITVHNTGDDDLNKVTVTGASGKKKLAQPFKLAVGEKQTITFNSSYRAEGQKQVAVKATARAAGSGAPVQDEAEATVQVKRPKPPPSKPDVLTLTKPFKLELVRVPADEFLMGSDLVKDKAAQENEQPQHKVNLPEFYIGKYPVTNAQYAIFLKATGHKAREEWVKKGWWLSSGIQFPSGDENHPAVYVTWRDAVAFCRWLTQESGQVIRLPTEAEWEKAARGTEGRIYPWGNKFDKNRCNIKEADLGTTTPVGQFSPQGDSPYGATDMAGNIWEWCSTIWVKKASSFQVQDEWNEDYLKKSGGRVLRGGSFYNDKDIARAAFRGGGDILYGSRFNGFRVVGGTAPFSRKLRTAD